MYINELEEKQETFLPSGKIAGTLVRIKFYKDGFLIGNLANNIGNVNIKGNIFSAQIGMKYEVEISKVENHPKFGTTFIFSDYKVIYPTDINAIQDYLIENCKWIGSITAMRLTDAYKDETLKVLKDDPARVAKEISGITEERAKEISEMLLKNEENEQLEIQMNKIFSGVAIPKRTIHNIFNDYGKDVIEKIQKNPYDLIQFKGIGFTKADIVASNMGFEKNSPFRIRAAILHILREQAMTGGHTRFFLDTLLEKAKELLNLEEGLIKKVILRLIEIESLIDGGDDNIEDKWVALPCYYQKEKEIAKKILEMMQSPADKITKELSLDNLADDQKQAITVAKKNPVFILTGAPGTGKTYTIKRILDLFEGNSVALAAPTGKAASRMKEMTGKNASTIHRLLKVMGSEKARRCNKCSEKIYLKETNEEIVVFNLDGTEHICNEDKSKKKSSDDFYFYYNKNNPLPDDVIIIDESSMIDVSLFHSLVMALKNNARLILVGDTYQLPAVGPGNILKDLIASKIPSVELTKIKRQDAGLIINNCHAIKNGKEMQYDNSVSSDFLFAACNEPERIQELILDLIVSDRLTSKFGIRRLWDIQVLSPVKEKTILSCKALNELLQKALNNQNAQKYKIWPGDKVIQMVNDNENGIVNGDIGYVTQLDSKYVYVDFENVGVVKLPRTENDLQLAYAITVHKYQGSECPVVIIPIHKSFGSMILQRNWLYTAISRAKKLCILVGQKTEIPKIIYRNQQVKRLTSLKRFIDKEMIGNEKGDMP